jgi:hypothetical protein
MAPPPPQADAIGILLGCMMWSRMYPNEGQNVEGHPLVETSTVYIMSGSFHILPSMEISSAVEASHFMEASICTAFDGNCEISIISTTYCVI